MLRGCDPKKVLVGGAEVIDWTRRFSERGIVNSNSLNWGKLMAFKRTFTDPAPKIIEESLKKAGIKTFHTHDRARFVGKNVLKVGDDKLEGRFIVIATGAKPMKLNIPGEEYLTYSDQFLELAALPHEVIFLGGGYISFEFAHIAARAGANVTIIHRSDKPLKEFDPDLVQKLVESSREVGIEVVLNSEVNAVRKKGDKLVVGAGEKEFIGDLVVHGAGRVPDIDGLDLEKAGVEWDGKRILTNEHLQTSNPQIFAAGDAAGVGPPLTPVAGLDGQVVAENILNDAHMVADYEGIPSVVFTIPPLATVGISEEEARKHTSHLKVNFEGMDEWYFVKRVNARHTGYKVLIDQEKDLILGAHIFSPYADDMINLFALAIQNNLSASQLTQTIYSYPSSSGEIKYMI